MLALGVKPESSLMLLFFSLFLSLPLFPYLVSPSYSLSCFFVCSHPTLSLDPHLSSWLFSWQFLTLRFLSDSSLALCSGQRLSFLISLQCRPSSLASGLKTPFSLFLVQSSPFKPLSGAGYFVPPLPRKLKKKTRSEKVALVVWFFFVSYTCLFCLVLFLSFKILNLLFSMLFLIFFFPFRLCKPSSLFISLHPFLYLFFFHSFSFALTQGPWLLSKLVKHMHTHACILCTLMPAHTKSPLFFIAYAHMHTHTHAKGPNLALQLLARVQLFLS